MTTQTIHFHTFDYGASLTSATLRSIADDTLVATADTVNEVTADSGLYAAVFGEASIISAGTYRLRAIVSGQPINRYVTLAGTNNEIVQARSERLSELDSSSLALFATVDTGQTTAVAGSVAKLSQGSGSGGDATLAKQNQILEVLQGSPVIQVASPNVSGNLVLTQGDTYDGATGSNPKATWTVTTDYTSGWSVTFTIRDSDDNVVYTTSGTVDSATSVSVAINAPTGLTMTGIPGQWQGKFDVQLTKSTSKKTIALGVCYINENQTR